MSYKNLTKVLLVVILIIVVVFGIYIFRDQIGMTLQRTYAAPSTLVSKEISTGANIVVTLPDKVDTNIKDEIKFKPEIKGTWVTDDLQANQIAFKPDQELEIGIYYEVILPLEDANMKQFFEIVEKPELIAVFPAKDSEANENSKITAVFNRPMIPLTTLDTVEKSAIPVTMEPDTPGKWKWISTRTLQFIPEEDLIRSSNYTVKALPGFQSFDGIGIAELEHKFTTRPLRYNQIDEGQLIYSRPINVRFNQPVDLEKTKNEITVKNRDTSDEIDIIVEYGTNSVWNKESRKYDKETDQSIIAVYQAKDQHGRDKLWNFKTEYEIKIDKAYPTEGDIMLDESKTSFLASTDIVKDIYATSKRSPYSSLTFIDPQGSIIIDFYEDIDLGRSNIKVDKKDRIEYTEACIPPDPEEGEEIVVWSTGDNDDVEECEKEDVRSRIKITFKSNEIGVGEKIQLTLEKIINSDGKTITVDPLEYDLYSYPEFDIKKIIQNGQQSASNEQLTICSSTPLYVPKTKREDPEDENEEVDNIDDFLSISPEYRFTRWRDSSYTPPGQSDYPNCAAYEFATKISYKLIPETGYEITTNLKDVFEQTGNNEASFTTGKLDKWDLNFYHIQDKYTITTPEKTKFTFAVENMPYVNMDLCKVSAPEMLETINDGLRYREPANTQANCEWESSVKVPVEGKYWNINYFQIQLNEYIESSKGHYIMTFSHPDYKNYSGQQMYEHAFVTLTDISAIEKEVQIYNYDEWDEKRALSGDQVSDLFNLYWITDINTLNPISGAEIDLYTRNRDDNYNYDAQFAKTITTSSDGTVETSVLTNPGGVIIKNGSDSAIIPDSEVDLQSSLNAYNNEKIFIYTDRPIYKPGDKVGMKGIYRAGYDGQYDALEGKTVTLSVFNSDYDSTYETDLTLNAFGTFDATYTIDASAPLGRYRIDVENASMWFEVEEYVGAAFKVDTTTDKEEYVAGDTFELDVQADYYFGVPVEGGELSYSIVAQDYYFDKYTDDYFHFGSGWYSCWWTCETNDTYLLRGEMPLNPDGSATISQELDFEKIFDDEEDRQKSKIFVVNLTVENTSGQQISSQKSFVVHAGEVYLGIQTSDYFISAGQDFDFNVKSVNTEGEEMKQGGIQAEINKVGWKSIKRKEVDGSFYYRTEKTLNKVDEFNFGTNGSGDYSKTLSIDAPGEYELSLTAKDGKGNLVRTVRTVYVHSGGTMGMYGEDERLIKPSQDTTLEIVNESGKLNVGETASFMIKNPFETKAKALIAIERGKIFDYEIVDIEQSFYNYEFTVEEDHLPNVYASVVLLSSEPGLKYGSTSFFINIDKKELDVKVTPNKETYIPGDTVELEFEVTDTQGNPAYTELSVAVVDLSVLALKGNPHKNPLKFFYNGLPLTISTSANLKNLLHEVEIKKGKGGGGGVDEKKKRGKFLDTAFFQAVLTTDKDGKAKITFELPDNLTTWQIESLGVTQDTKLGISYNEIMTQKQLMLTPLKPRFIVPGDKFKLGAKIFNQTDGSINLKVTAQSDSLTLDGDEQSISISKDETKTVYFNATAPLDVQTGVHKFTLSAKAGDEYEDTVEQSISITRNDTYETVATANYTSNEQAIEFIFVPEDVVPDRGTLRINTSATLAVFISDGLNSLLSFPYGCTEQIASKLDAIAIVTSGLDLENIGDKFEIEDIIIDGQKYTLDELVDIGMARIYKNQKSDGGFGYFSNWESNFYLTMRIVTTLSRLEAAGYDVNDDVVNSASKYIVQKINNDPDYQAASNIINAAYALSGTKNGSEYVGVLAPRIKENILNDEKFINEDVNNMTLAYLAILLADNSDLFSNTAKESVFNVLESRMRIDARGAYLPSSSTRFWAYYETDHKNTALMLKAFAIDQRDNTQLGNVLRWLLNSRTKDGAWGSTDSTLTVIDGFTEYLKWQKENESDFNLAINLGDEEIGNFDFNAETILNQENVTIQPLTEVGIGELLPLVFKKTNNNNLPNNFYYDIDMRYYLPIETIAPRDEGFAVSRNLYTLEDEDMETPVNSAKVGDILHGRLEIVVPETRNYVAVEDYLPAGVELINFDFATENKNILGEEKPSDEFGYGKGGWGYEQGKFYPKTEELRDDRLFLFTDYVSPGTYHYDYYVRVLIPGEYHHLPAVASEMYFPENFGRTEGNMFTVNE